LTPEAAVDETKSALPPVRDLIEELVAAPGPPGQEEEVRAVAARYAAALGYESRVDAKGNLLVTLPGWSEEQGRARCVVTAHLDEIALMVKGINRDGTLAVAPLGGVHPWKWGEQPVEILTRRPITGILSFGSIHTNSPAAPAQQARTGPLEWGMAFIFTGMSPEELFIAGVRPGTRVVLARERRAMREIGEYLVSYFLDDRADVAAWLLALEMLRGEEFPNGLVFAATVSEEVGGEGALYLLNRLQPDLCVALEIGPSVPESPFRPDADPTVWVNDSYAAIAARDIALVEEVAMALGQEPHWQPLTRGGSDASCAASRGLCARPITFGLPVENSHGLEIMHRRAPGELARLAAAFVRRTA
jgi:putative aminopeptidase FrvX